MTTQKVVACIRTAQTRYQFFRGTAGDSVHLGPIRRLGIDDVARSAPAPQELGLYTHWVFLRPTLCHRLCPSQAGLKYL